MAYNGQVPIVLNNRHTCLYCACMYHYVHNLQLSYSCSDFVDSFLLNKWRELYIQPSFDDDGRFAKVIAGWLGGLACHQKDFQPDSHGQVSEL